MTKFEARVRTTFGDIAFQFETLDELKIALQSLDVTSTEKEVQTKFAGVLKKEPRPAKPGLESLYRFTPEGMVELLKTAPSAPMSMGLLLYAYDGALSSDEIFSSCGVKAGDYVSQTTYKKFFDKTSDGKHVLTFAGRQWVENEVLPKLTKSQDETKPK